MDLILSENSFYLFKIGTNGILCKSQENDLILKFILIDFNKKSIKISSVNSFASVNLYSFLDEVNFQLRAYDETKLCPRVYYATPNFDLRNSNFSICGEHLPHINEKLHAHLDQKPHVSVGAILMDKILDRNYIRLYEYLKINKQMFSDYMLPHICYVYIRLAVVSGIQHGDMHSGNVFIDAKNPTEIRSRTPCLIDFGYSSKIADSDLALLRQRFEAREYGAILSYLMWEIPRSDGVHMSEFMKEYGYVLRAVDEKKIWEIHQSYPRIYSDMSPYREFPRFVKMGRRFVSLSPDFTALSVPESALRDNFEWMAINLSNKIDKKSIEYFINGCFIFVFLIEYEDKAGVLNTDLLKVIGMLACLFSRELSNFGDYVGTIQSMLKTQEGIDLDIDYYSKKYYSLVSICSFKFEDDNFKHPPHNYPQTLLLELIMNPRYYM